jgi:thiamine transporter
MADTRTRILVEIALTVALAAVLNLVKLWRMPYGGDVSLEMLPIVVLALRRGWRSGMSAGVLYGVVAMMLGAVVVHWAQFLLDYPLAYSLVGVGGVFTGLLHKAREAERGGAAWIVAGVATGAAARFVSHFVSGLVFFGQYAPDGQPAWLYSLLYNGVYMLPATILCAIAAAIILPALERAVPTR